MRKLGIVEFVTLDGVMQSLGSPDEDREGGFAYGGWSAPYGDEIAGQAAAEGMTGTTAYLFGRKTYEKMAAHWPFEPDTNPIAAHLNATSKYVVSKTLTGTAWSGTSILSGDAAASVRDLKENGDGGIVVLGSGVLVQTLVEHDLIDEYRIFVHPLVLGTGKRLFRETSQPLRLRLMKTAQTSTGVLLLTYQPESRRS
ncbi:MAG: dihydrofolate reductase family protein [Streptosporangiaceae bacterium]